MVHLAIKLFLKATDLNQIFAEATGQSIERIEADTQRDFWLNTQEALDYGLLGKVIRSVDELK